MWLLGIELRTSGRAVNALNRWANSPALKGIDQAGLELVILLPLPPSANPTGVRHHNRPSLYFLTISNSNSLTPVNMFIAINILSLPYKRDVKRSEGAWQ